MIAIVSLALLSLGSTAALAQQAESQVMTTTTSGTEQAPKLPSGELDSLVAPIALYSDQLLAQTLAASTYPLEIIQLQQWMAQNKNLKGKALGDAVAKQPWDPSVQGLVEFPDVVQRMAGNIQWTTDLGNAFLAQQSDVMDAIQRMRAKAQGTGNLKTSAQQKVETQTVEGGKQVIVVQPANPEVVYVPSYDPTVVYGAPAPEYPYYPYTYPGYVPGTALMWGAGIALGAAAWGAWGGHWGDCNWGGGDVNINNNNNFNRNSNRNVNRGQAGQGNRWQHNPQHRGNAPYGDRGTANKFGGRGPGGVGGAGGAGGAGRLGGAGGIGGAGKPGGAGGAGGIGGAGKPGGAGGAGGIGGAGRPGGAGGAGVGKPGGAGAGARPGGGSAKSQVGNRSASSRPSAGAKGGGFSGGSGNYARASSSRGGQSMGGGGMSRGGGGGMSRGGGGGRGGGGMSRGGGGGRGGGGRGGGGGGRRR
ncbi:MAG: DUF3300 domain-containing protein [Verrucomicrobia bacterium]|nr:MAG: DUF3300 domain-containing protein [Verrucomicrobiota bacterium]